MQLFFHVLLSVQLAIGPFIWFSEVIQLLSTETPVVQLSEAQTTTLIDCDTGRSFEILSLDTQQSESIATSLFDNLCGVLFTPARGLVSVLPDLDTVWGQIAQNYLDIFSAPYFQIIQSE